MHRAREHLKETQGAAGCCMIADGMMRTAAVGRKHVWTVDVQWCLDVHVRLMRCIMIWGARES